MERQLVWDSRTLPLPHYTGRWLNAKLQVLRKDAHLHQRFRRFVCLFDFYYL